jgi:hypothetical protein
MLSTTAHHPGMSFTQYQLGHQKAMSNKIESITPRRNQTDVRSLREPVVLRQRFPAQSENGNDINDIEQSQFDKDVSCQSTSRARSSAFKPDMSLQAIARAALPGNLEYTEIPAEPEKLHSEDSSSDEDARLPKRRKVTSLTNDSQKYNSFNELRQHESSLSTFGWSNTASIDTFRSPGLDLMALDRADDASPRPFQRAPVAPMMSNMCIKRLFTAVTAISALNEDNADCSNTVVTIHDNANMIPARPHDPRNFSEVVQRMRSAYVAYHSTTEPKWQRWIIDPSNSNGPPIREKKARRHDTRSGVVYIEHDGPNFSPTWHYRTTHGLDKKICTVNDIPNLVAAAYCDPRYTNEKQLFSTLTNDYSGVREQDIRFCLAGIRADRVSAENNPSPTCPDGDEASQVPPVSPLGHPSACPGNDFSSSAYLSPVTNFADISQSATAGFGT